MTLPPALLQRLAQRGLMQRPTLSKETDENEEVIAENYDDMETENSHRENISDDYQHPPQYETSHGNQRKPNEDNYWLTQMKARMSEAGSHAGYKGCPNKYNIWHKCTLYCINRWGEGTSKPNSEYMIRYKRLLRKYPLPKDWVEMYDPGSASYYFACEADNVVSWLPPTHPKSQITKSAATIRKHMEESNGEGTDSDEERLTDDDSLQETANEKHQREVNDIINSSIKSTSPKSNNSLDSHEFPSLEEAIEAPTVPLPRKQKTRDLNRILSKQRKERGRDDFNAERETDREHHSKRPKDDSSEPSHSEENSGYSCDPPWPDDLPVPEDNHNSSDE